MSEQPTEPKLCTNCTHCRHWHDPGSYMSPPDSGWECEYGPDTVIDPVWMDWEDKNPGYDCDDETMAKFGEVCPKYEFKPWEPDQDYPEPEPDEVPGVGYKDFTSLLDQERSILEGTNSDGTSWSDTQWADYLGAPRRGE